MTDVEKLITEARKTADRIRNVIGPSDRYADMIDRLADTLEATLAELRQDVMDARAALSRAEETIDVVRDNLGGPKRMSDGYVSVIMTDTRAILDAITDYDKQKEDE